MSQFIISLVLTVVLLMPSSALALSSIDSPLSSSVQSGTVAPPTGWICPRNGQITAQVDGGPTISFTEDRNRGDTAGPCGNSGNNAFIIADPWNWNIFGDGQHAIIFFDNGVQFASITFEVATFGTEFLFGPTVSFTMQNFPDPGADVEVSWDNAIQNFRITRIVPGTTGGGPPLAPGSLLGTWRFTYTLTTSTFTDEFTLDSLTSAAGPLVATGKDEFGNFAVGGIIQDISPGSALPFDYGVFWQGILLCTLHLFDLTSNTTAAGIVSLFIVRTNGSCGSNINGVNDTTVGIRTGAPKSIVHLADQEKIEQAKFLLARKPKQLDLETERALTDLMAAFQEIP